MSHQHIVRSGLKFVLRACAAVAVSMLCAPCVASNPLRVVFAAGMPVPLGEGTTATSVSGSGIGAGGHVAIGIVAGDLRFSGLYLFGPDGSFLNRALADEAQPGQSGPGAVSISLGGTVTASRRPQTWLSSNNAFFLLHPDGTRTDYGAFGSTFPGAGARVVDGLPIVTPYANIFEETYDNRPGFGVVRLSPGAIGSEILNAALVQFNLDGTMTPLVLDGNLPGSQILVSWPRDVSSDGAVLYTSSELNVPQSNALRIWRNGVLERVLGTGDPHPTLENYVMSGYTQAQLNARGDVLVDGNSRDAAGEFINDTLWRRQGTWRKLPEKWSFVIDGRSVMCESEGFTLLEDGTALFRLRYRIPSESNSRIATAQVAYDGTAVLLTHTGQLVRSRDGGIGTYATGSRSLPNSLRDVHTAFVRVGAVDEFWVVVRDLGGDLVSLAAPRDTFTYNGAVWTITQIFNSMATGSNVIISALASSPGQAEIHFVLATSLVGAGCGDIDFNNDAVYPSEQDFIDFFGVFAGNPCSTLRCDTIDFNRNGVFPEDQDALDFFHVLAGGSCNP